MTTEKAKIGWVVDVQNDFMKPELRLYVHDLFNPEDKGAVLAQPRIEEAVQWMEENCDVVVFTGDWHSYDDPEIDPVNPDPAKGTYPPHCMGLSEDPEEREGAEIIDSIRPENPVILERDVSPEIAREVAARAIEEKRPIFIKKHQFSVFTGNSATEHLLEALKDLLRKDLEVYGIGVARDVCVTQAIDGMAERNISTVAIKDATWGLGLEPEEETLKRWAGRGRVVSLRELNRKNVVKV